MNNIFNYLSPSRVPSSVSARGILVVQRETLLQYILNLFLVGCVVSTFWAIQMVQNPTYVGMLPVLILFYLAIIGLVFFRTAPYLLRSGLVIAVFYVAGVIYLARNGLSGAGILMIFLTTVLANYLFDFWVGGGVFIASIASIIVVGDLMTNRQIPLPTPAVLASSSSPNMWIMMGALFFLAGLVTLIANRVVSRGLSEALTSQQALTNQLEQEQLELENRIRERSSNIQSKLAQFEVASQIARDISAETNLEVLIDSAVKQIRNRFGFYHAGIFLADDHNEYAILRAATGDAGKTMLERNHRLKIGEIGIVGYVVSKGEPRISGDVTEDKFHYKNPLLPDTRSEMALPLKIGNRTIGALDVQSVVENAFNQDDIRILQTIADQLAIAVDKSQLLQKLQTNLEELEMIQRQNTKQTWQAHIRNARRKFAYHYRHSPAQLELDAPETAQTRQAMQSGQPVMEITRASQAQGDREVTKLAVPIKLRNQVIGVVDIQFDSQVVSSDLISLIENTVDRLAVSLENARLLEEIQTRAERERLVSEITTKVRATSDVDNILRIAAQELGKSLGVSEVMVQLRNS